MYHYFEQIRGYPLISCSVTISYSISFNITQNKPSFGYFDSKSLLFNANFRNNVSVLDARPKILQKVYFYNFLYTKRINVIYIYREWFVYKIVDDEPKACS